MKPYFGQWQTHQLVTFLVDSLVHHNLRGHFQKDLWVILGVVEALAQIDGLVLY